MSDEEVYFGEVRQFWQTDQLYRVEHARRALAAARQALEARGRDLAEMRRRSAEYNAQWSRMYEERRLRRLERAARVRLGPVWPDRERWIWRRRLSGASYREISEDFGISLSFARTIFKARERFEKERLAVWVREVWLPRADEWQDLILARAAALAEFAAAQGVRDEQQ